jgi:HD superfamily phosphohydrolase
MYWQVYLHKAVVAGDQLLRAVLRRARHLLASDDAGVRDASPGLCFFLERELSAEDLSEPAVVDQYTSLDDSDILYSLKRWSTHGDVVLADLAQRFLGRRFPRVTFLDARPDDTLVELLRDRFRETGILKVTSADGDADRLAEYYVCVDSVDHAAYESSHDSINVIDASGRIRELSKMADAASVLALTNFETRWYVCVPKDLDTRDLL